MKIVVTVMFFFALMCFIPKNNQKNASEAVFSKPAITYTDLSAPGEHTQPATLSQQPETLKQPHYISNNRLAEQQITKFAKTQYRSLAVSDATLQKIAEKIVKYSTIYGVDYALSAALIARESSFNPNAVSSHGAKGLGS